MSRSGKAPIAEAIDHVVADVLAPTLEERGFRKQGHHWSHDTDAAHRAVSVQGSQVNAGATGRFTIELGVSYPCVGEPRPDKPGVWYCTHRARIGQLLPDGGDLWWSFHDARDEAERQERAASVREVWTTVGLPFLDRIEEPDEWVEHLLRWPVVGLEAIELAERTGDRSRLDRAIDGRLSGLRSDPYVPPHAVPDPFPLGRLAVDYAEPLPHLRAAGRSLVGDDLARARQVVTEAVGALEAGHQHELYRHRNRDELLRELGDHLGVETRHALDASGS